MRRGLATLATALALAAPSAALARQVLPNPVYGSALQGGPDDIFPKDKQWRDFGPPKLPASEAATEKAPVPVTSPKKAK